MYGGGRGGYGGSVKGERYYEAYISYGEKVLLSYALRRSSIILHSLQQIEKLVEEHIVTGNL